MKPEAKFRRSVVEPYLKSLKNTYSISIQQTSIRGDSDKILCVYGHFVALELKASNGRESQLQAFKRMQINVKGKGIALVASPENWEDVSEFIRKLDGGIRDTDQLLAIMQSQFRAIGAKAGSNTDEYSASVQGSGRSKSGEHRERVSIKRVRGKGFKRTSGS